MSALSASLARPLDRMEDRLRLYPRQSWAPPPFVVRPPRRATCAVLCVMHDFAASRAPRTIGALAAAGVDAAEVQETLFGNVMSANLGQVGYNSPHGARPRTARVTVSCVWPRGCRTPPASARLRLASPTRRLPPP